MNLEVFSKEVSNSHLALESQAVILSCKGSNDNINMKKTQ